MNCLCFSKLLSDRELEQILSSFFNLSQENIQIFGDIGDFNGRGKEGRNVVRTELGGQYPLWIDIYGFPESTDLALAEHAVQLLDTEVLISDDTLNPFRWFQVTFNGVRAVFVTENYDEIGFYLVGGDEL